ncbi:ribonucleoprotein PTB-binding 1-like isoform X2 [Mya arenaria]|uniref:ribonucleoprotein PTB-binding 1-like isoform X2 n=1 Tax=Mya arenaria TaxID=6604 RepID=UPI0022E19B36|nr:ribonucleoprotein PTB-binding 1-like isoform X2 [Mya arenaria]
MKREEGDEFSDKASKMELLEKAKAEFNREKRLVIKNLPFSTTEKDIRAFMGFNGEFPVEDVQMGKNLGQNQAVVTLKDPSLVDDAISKLDNTKFDTLTVSVSVYRSDKILCIAHLPLAMTEYKFRELITEHGNIDMCFLMRSEETGDSKGYGFVEFNESIEKVGQIKYALDWSKVEGQVVHCDAIVDSSKTGIEFADLHSTCLLIDNLPPDYTDCLALREVFSQLVKPIYCQIVTKENVSLGFGIIEYENSENAERAFNRFNNEKINDVPMNISYCIPGKSAVHMFNRIMFKYGDSIHVNKASLLPDPVYPNPAFLRHPFFKTHQAKHPRLLVKFTDNLLNLQEGYIKQLEDKTNTKPGLLGPAPTIPMSPLMDVNVQLGLLSVIVLDMRENGTYNGQLPGPLGKLKVPSGEDFEQKPEPVSLLGDPVTAQANLVLKNLLMPPSESPGFPQGAVRHDPEAPQLLGKPIAELNLVCLGSLGRMMAMMLEQSHNRGLLGNAPPQPTPNGPPKPLLDGLMQAGKVAQKILNSIGMNQQNQNNFNSNYVNMNQSSQSNNFSHHQGNQPRSLLGNPPGNMNMGMNNMNMNTSSNMNMNTSSSFNMNRQGKGNSNFMSNMQQALSVQKMSESQGGNMNRLGGNNMLGGYNDNSSNQGDGLLGNYRGQGSSSSNSPQSLLGAPPSQSPTPLLSLNLNTKGEGLIPTPPTFKEEGGFLGNQGMGGNDSGYQGGYDEGDGSEGFCDQGNMNSMGNMGNYGSSMGTFGNMGNFSNNGNFRNNMGNFGNGDNTSMGNFRSNMGNFRNMGNSNNMSGNMGNMGPQSLLGMNQRNMAGGMMDQANSETYDAAYFSGINNRQRNSANLARQQSDGSREFTKMTNNAALLAATGSRQQNMGSWNNMGASNFSDSEGPYSMQQRSNGSSMFNKASTGDLFTFQNTNSFGAIGNKGDGLMGPPPQPLLGMGSSFTSGNNNTSTPQGQKRPFSHLLPSPEASPEGNYIGQHSQGLGGHYAESYQKRQKLSGRF